MGARKALNNLIEEVRNRNFPPGEVREVGLEDLSV